MRVVKKDKEINIKKSISRKKNKKSITPVVATILLIVVAVFAVVGFGKWFNSYESSTFTKIESSSIAGIGTINIEMLTPSYLYVLNKNNFPVNFTNIKIGSNDCNINGTLEPNTVTEIFIGSCLFGLKKKSSMIDVVLITPENIFSKTFLINNLINLISIYNPNDENLTNFQVEVNATNLINAFGTDFKVELSNGSLVNYCFIQSNGECNANYDGVNKIWLKVPYLLENTTTYLTLISSDANNAVSGGDIFDFYDDFDEGIINTSKWHFVEGSLNNGNYHFSGGHLVYTALPFGIKSISLNYSTGIFVFRYYVTNVATGGQGLGVDNVLSCWRDDFPHDYVDIFNGSDYIDVANNPTSFAILKVVKTRSNISLYINNTKKGIEYSTNRTGSIWFGNLGYHSEDATDFIVDYIFVRKYAPKDPVVSVIIK